MAEPFVPVRHPLRWAVAGVFALALPLDLATLNPGLGFIDRGELATVAATLGIAHPTGYPLFTLLGHLATLLVPARPVLVLNVLAALLTAAGAAVLVALYDELLRRAAGARAGAAPRAVAAALGALLTATGSIWWQQANGWEVYALQSLLLPVALLLGLRWLRLGGTRAALAFAFALGLAFTNHLTTVLAVPAMLVAIAADPRRAQRLLECPAMAPAFVLALTPYAYLPLRAAQHPLLDWSEPVTLGRFFNHVSAREFRSWMFASGDDFVRQAAYIARLLPADLAWAGAAVALAGLAWLVRRDTRGALFTLLLFAACVVYACGYGIRDIDSYLLMAALVTGAWFAAGLLALGGMRTRNAAALATGVGVVLIAVNFALHLADCDEHALHLPEDLARAQLRALPPHAVIFDAQWDYTLSPSIYLQAVEHVRPDVTVIGTGFLRQPWYVRALARRDPALLPPAGEAYRRFLAEVAPFEEGRPFDPASIDRAWHDMLRGMVAHALATRPVCATLAVEDGIGEGVPRVPMGLFWRLSADTAYVPATDPAPVFRPARGRVDPYIATTSWIYGTGYAARAEYEWRHGRRAAAQVWLRAALRFDPHIDPARVPVQPLDGNELVRSSADLFARLHSAAGR